MNNTLKRSLLHAMLVKHAYDKSGLGIKILTKSVDKALDEGLALLDAMETQKKAPENEEK